MPCGCMVFAFSIYNCSQSLRTDSLLFYLYFLEGEEILKNCIFSIRFIYSTQFKMVSFRGQKKVSHAQIGLLLGS